MPTTRKPQRFVQLEARRRLSGKTLLRTVQIPAASAQMISCSSSACGRRRAWCVGDVRRRSSPRYATVGAMGRRSVRAQPSRRRDRPRRPRAGGSAGEGSPTSPTRAPPSRRWRSGSRIRRIDLGDLGSVFRPEVADLDGGRRRLARLQRRREENSSGMRAQPHGVDLVLPLVRDPGLDQVLREDPAGGEELVVGLERVERLGERARHLRD